VRGRARGYGCVGCEAGNGGGSCGRGDGGVVEGAPTVVDARGEVVVAADGEPGEGDVGSWNAELVGY
jgi:hypothetical protein